MLFVKPLANDDKHRLTSLYRLNSDVLVGGIKLKPLALSVLHKAFYTEYLPHLLSLISLLTASSIALSGSFIFIKYKEV